MENASKALVIAGAILISILIIGLGVFIYNGAASTVSKSNLNSQEAQAQNQQFEAYFGDKRSAAEVKQLCSLVRSNNITSNAASEEKAILIVMDSSTPAASGPQAVSTAVKAGKTYNVNVANDTATDKIEDKDPTQWTDKSSSYYKSGFIRVITVKENKRYCSI